MEEVQPTTSTTNHIDLTELADELEDKVDHSLYRRQRSRELLEAQSASDE